MKYFTVKKYRTLYISRQDKVMRPSSKGTYGGWLLFEKVTQDMRLTFGDRSEQFSISLIIQGVNAGEVIGQIAPSTKSRQELSINQRSTTLHLK